MEVDLACEENASFELLTPVRLNTVCFTLAGAEGQEQVGSFLSKLNNTQQVFMTATVYNGRKGIRAAFVNWRATTADVELVTKLMSDIIAKR